MPGRRPLVNIQEAPTVAYLMKIAAAHCSKAISSKSQDEQVSSTLIAVVFMAAAAESAINLFLALPIASIQDTKLRRLYGALVTEQARMNLPNKLELLKGVCPTLAKHNCLGLTREVFAHRNSIVHIRVKYQEFEQAISLHAGIPLRPQATDLPAYLKAVESFVRILAANAVGEDYVLKRQ